MKTKKRIIPSLQPRNPLVAAAYMRHAGSHRPSNKVLRAQNKRQVQRDIQADLGLLHRGVGRDAGEYVRVF